MSGRTVIKWLGPNRWSSEPRPRCEGERETGQPGQCRRVARYRVVVEQGGEPRQFCWEHAQWQYATASEWHEL